MATVHRTWIPLFVIALVLGIAFTTVYLGLQRDPRPRDLPVAAVGAALSEQMVAGLGAMVDVTAVATAEAGADLVRSGEAVAVIAEDSPTALRLDYAGSAGMSESGAVRQLVAGFAGATGATVTETDIVPLVRYDTRGLATFYVVFGVTLSSFILAQLLVGGGAVFARLRHRFFVMAAFTVAIGLIAATIAGPVYGTLPASFPTLALSLVLLSAAVAFATSAMAAWLGPPGISLAVLVFTVIGNATSGATIGYDLLPDWAQAVSARLPTGAATRLIEDFGYFGGSGVGSSVTVLLLWFGASAGLIALRRRRLTHRGRHLAGGLTASPAMG